MILYAHNERVTGIIPVLYEGIQTLESNHSINRVYWMARGFYRVWCKIKAALKLNELEFRPTPCMHFCHFAI